MRNAWGKAYLIVIGTVIAAILSAVSITMKAISIGTALALIVFEALALADRLRK
jgi:hypothetical protein